MAGVREAEVQNWHVGVTFCRTWARRDTIYNGNMLPPNESAKQYDDKNTLAHRLTSFVALSYVLVHVQVTECSMYGSVREGSAVIRSLCETETHALNYLYSGRMTGESGAESAFLRTSTSS